MTSTRSDQAAMEQAIQILQRLTSPLYRMFQDNRLDESYDIARSILHYDDEHADELIDMLDDPSQLAG